MSITFMHNFHTKISIVNNINSGINYTILTINYKLVGKLKSIMLIAKAVNQISVIG
ncbi:hypothetical protein OIU77_006633 [Salix suchowensis]|uniref:Uncharacterized protein n=1 Tax=Salix suchowensis TaxID=1278906 RepID=A0ABQ9AMT1_9ROSI|nr:hypothetical protein OIU77_006633 [Salix suchowensis]